MKLLLFLHLLGAVLFLGNIVTAAFWKIRADVRGETAVIHSAARNVMLADLVFTIPGLILLIGSGLWVADVTGYSLLELNWLTTSIALFTLTGILWLAVLLPVQKGMIRHSAAALAGQGGLDAYRRLSKYWAAAGTAATLLPLGILYLMLVKPF